MNYRERYEMRREEGRKRRRRNARNSVVVLIVSAVIIFAVWFLAGGKKQEEENVNSEAGMVSQASSTVTPVGLSDWNLILVNNDHLLPLDYTIPGLAEVAPEQEVDERIANITKKMIDDAKTAGVTIEICSAYRSVSHQQRLFEREEPKPAGQPISVQAPGASEHHTGLAIDVVCPEFDRLERGFENTAAFRWLDAHAWEYGFILRFPRDKEAITGIIYEPWHYRYVGIAHAKEIKEQKICLEEYLQRQ